MPGGVRRYRVQTTIPPKFLLIGIHGTLFLGMQPLILGGINITIAGQCRVAIIVINKVTGAKKVIFDHIGLIRRIGCSDQMLQIHEAFLQVGIFRQERCKFCLHRIQLGCDHIGFGIGGIISGFVDDPAKICLLKEIDIVAGLDLLNIVIDQGGQGSLQTLGVHIALCISGNTNGVVGDLRRHRKLIDNGTG